MRGSLASAILTTFAEAQISAYHTRLIAFTIFLKTATFLAMATSCMEGFFLFDFSGESVGVPFYYRIYSRLTLLIANRVAAALTITLRPTALSK